MIASETNMPSTLGEIIISAQVARHIKDEDMNAKLGFTGLSAIELLRRGRLYPAFRTLPTVAQALEISQLDALKLFFADTLRDVIDNLEAVYLEGANSREERYVLQSYRDVVAGRNTSLRLNTGEATVVILTHESKGV